MLIIPADQTGWWKSEEQMGFCRRRSRVPRLQLYGDDTIYVYTIYNMYILYIQYTIAQPASPTLISVDCHLQPVAVQCNKLPCNATYCNGYCVLCPAPRSNIPSELHRNANTQQPNSSYLSCTLTTAQFTVVRSTLVLVLL